MRVGQTYLGRNVRIRGVVLEAVFESRLSPLMALGLPNTFQVRCGERFPTQQKCITFRVVLTSHHSLVKYPPNQINYTFPSGSRAVR